MPRASSRAELAKRTEPSPRTTATRVASRSRDWKRSEGIKGLVKPSFSLNAGELSPQAGDVVLVAGDVGLQLRHAIDPFLVVAVLGAELFRITVVVFLDQFGLPGLG